jgi:hypothetical protein
MKPFAPHSKRHGKTKIRECLSENAMGGAGKWPATNSRCGAILDLGIGQNDL